jgi:6-phosphogluconolactonase
VAARDYETEIRTSFTIVEGEIPRFDLVLLGLGEDGHTASLFPGTQALQEKRKLVTEVYVPRLDANRITLTLPVLTNARHVHFLVAGQGKAMILNEILNGNQHVYPAQSVRPVDGELTWLVDREAASHLTKTNVP